MGNPKKNNKKRPQILDRPYGKHAKLEDEIKHLQNGYEKIDTSTIKTFAQFPLSEKTQEALRRGKYTTPTSIQLQTIGLALQGKDVLGAAKTGSGKTLAFLIPLIECLYRQRWQHIDGVGALVISPTRELAYQTFEVLKKIGKIHDFSAGLAIGGKFMREESACINKTNIVICTPGRLLHHMDQTVNFNLDYLQMLVLDEADRILDLGFKKTMTGIIENLPRTRQTLLFSATQTKSVKELARLSLKSPVYVSIHEKDSHSTPTNLRQKYMVCDLEEKINIVWSFLQTHHNYKTLIFLNSCKQVRYVHESFKNLKAGLTVLALHGSMKQLKRVDIYEQFCNKQHVALIATDIASRGLDFPGVQWVIQMDCPEDTTIYIHRVGRTARYKENGEALLLLTPSEEPAMVKALKHKKIPIDEIKINHSKLRSIQGKLEAQCAADPQMKEFAQRAFMSYIKSIYMMKNKEIFNIHNYDLDKYSSSLGLANPPRIRFLQKAERRAAQQKSVNDVDDTRLSDTEANFNDDDASDDGEFLTVKRRDVQIPEEEMAELDDDLEKLEEKKNSQKKGMTQAQYAKKLMKKKILVNKKTTFDDEGGIVHDPYKPRTDDIEEADAQGLNLSDARSRMIEEDQTDKQLYRDLIKKRKREKKIKKKEDKKKWLDRQKTQEKEEEPEVVLGTPDSDADGSGGESPDDREEYQGPRGSFQQFDHDSDDEEMEEQRVRKKRKLMKASEKGNPSVLRDAEDLAMMLLS